jgi:hypothetical protein
MKFLALSVAFLCATLTASPAAAQAVRASNLQRFIDTYRGDPPDSTSTDWDDILYLSAVLTRTPEEAIAEFARRIATSRPAAREYASVILDAALPVKTCEGRPQPAQCVFAPGQRRYERAASLVRADRSGRLLVALAKRPEVIYQDSTALLTLIASHPSASSTFARLFQRGASEGNLTFFLAAAASGPMPQWLAQLAATSVPHSYGQPHDDAWRQALLEFVEAPVARDGASPATRAALAHLTLGWKLRSGLIDEAVASYYAYPRGIRSLLRFPMRCPETPKGCRDADRYRLGDELGAALWLTGHKDEARKWIRKAVSEFGPRSRDAESRYLALTEVISPTRSAEELFSLFVSYPLGVEATGYDKGWLFGVRGELLAVRRMVGERLRTAGYESMARYLEIPLVLGGARPDIRLAAVAALFPEAVRPRQEFWVARIDAAIAEQRAKSAPPGPLRVSTRPLPQWWIEKPLPDSMPPWQSSDAKQEPPRGARLPVPRDAVLRYEERNGERAIVYLSTEYESPRATSAAGIWFAKTTRGAWDRAVYLGLQQDFPYAVMPASRLPMLEGSRLRLEVRKPEITRRGPATPMPLVPKCAANGLYLEFNLAVLATDRDGDGLTDIAERRLGLDFARPDTDGDGVADGQDPLPLVRFRRTNTGTDRLARTILSEHGWKPRLPRVGVTPTLDRVKASLTSGGMQSPFTDTQFLIADPAMFSGVATAFRLMVYSLADMAALDRGGAPFSPDAVLHVFSSSARTRHYVTTQHGWFYVACQCPNDECTVRHSPFGIVDYFESEIAAPPCP